mmetsp:Transcript_784/g.2113  ORF Transcript_784/g.2113 Transcript_784/m.2113 type:complete len:276 (-) Transcript_784:1153-1980(-)
MRRHDRLLVSSRIVVPVRAVARPVGTAGARHRGVAKLSQQVPRRALTPPVQKRHVVHACVGAHNAERVRVHSVQRGAGASARFIADKGRCRVNGGVGEAAVKGLHTRLAFTRQVEAASERRAVVDKRDVAYVGDRSLHRECHAAAVALLKPVGIHRRRAGCCVLPCRVVAHERVVDLAADIHLKQGHAAARPAGGVTFDEAECDNDLAAQPAFNCTSKVQRRVVCKLGTLNQDIAVRRPADGPTEGCRVVFENTLVDVNVCHLQVDGTAHRGVAV